MNLREEKWPATRSEERNTPSGRHLYPIRHSRPTLLPAISFSLTPCCASYDRNSFIIASALTITRGWNPTVPSPLSFAFPTPYLHKVLDDVLSEPCARFSYNSDNVGSISDWPAKLGRYNNNFSRIRKESRIKKIVKKKVKLKRLSTTKLTLKFIYY